MTQACLTSNRTAVLLAMAVLFNIAAAFPAAATVPDRCPGVLAGRVPVHSDSVLTGSEFARQVAGLAGSERDAAIQSALLAGDLPSFLRHLKPVSFQGRRSHGGTARIVICVTPDYLAVGSDADFLRVPMGLQPALTIARRFGFVLPTTKMVDAIYAQADVHLVPLPLPAGPEMRSTDYMWRHNSMIHAQRQEMDAPLGKLVAGHKKDIALTGRLWAQPQRVAIYGWQHPDGTPIQPLSTVHGARYADYSHGVRLVSATAYVDGEARSIYDILEDPELAPIISTEGPIRDVTRLVTTLSGTVAADGQMAEAPITP